MNLNLIHYPILTSTNDEAKRLLAEGAPEGTMVWADCQTKGRGRHQRLWISQEGNLFCSLILRPDVPLDKIGQLSFVFALAVGDTLQTFLAEQQIQYKWPNDILIDGKKIAGILLETESRNHSHASGVIAGIGINIQSNPTTTPYPTTCLAAHISDCPVIHDFIPGLFQAIQRWYGIWLEKGFEPIRLDWLKKAYQLGEEVTASAASETICGHFEGIDEVGALILNAGDRQYVLTSAEVMQSL